MEEKYQSNKYSKKAYRTNKTKDIGLYLDEKNDELILDTLKTAKQKYDISRLQFIKIALKRKINRNQDKVINISHLISDDVKPTNNKRISVVLTDKHQNIIDEIEKAPNMSEYIRNAIYELLCEGEPTEQEIKEIKRETKKNNLVGMRPQIALYKDDKRDKQIISILKEQDKTLNREEFIKDAIIEKYEREKK